MSEKQSWWERQPRTRKNWIRNIGLVAMVGFGIAVV